jgi:NAD(P)-dependent dehydrogenase (short-subunit alcohol dehydrogenase family)
MVMDVFDLTGELAVITGGAGLLGRKHSEALIEAGADVVILDNNIEALNDCQLFFNNKYGKKIMALNVDLREESSIINAKKTIYEKIGKNPGILINNAAIDAKFEKKSDVVKSRLEHFELEQWNLEIAVGLTGAMLCCKVFGPEMAKNGKGVILNIASDLGLIAPDQRLYQSDELNFDSQNVKPVTYSVIKHGLIGLTKYIATYWSDRGVRCNAFAPGGVFNDHSDDFVKNISSRIPMGRMAEVDEYKASILFMCSDASSYMNGATLSMDGGRSAW